MYTQDQLKADITFRRSFIFILVQFCDLKKRLLTAVRCHSNRFLILRNYTRMVVTRV